MKATEESFKELKEFWRIHEDLCDIWSNDDQTHEEMDAEFREYIRKNGWDNYETADPHRIGDYIQSRVIYALREYMTLKEQEE